MYFIAHYRDIPASIPLFQAVNIAFELLLLWERASSSLELGSSVHIIHDSEAPRINNDIMYLNNFEGEK